MLFIINDFKLTEKENFPEKIPDRN